MAVPYKKSVATNNDFFKNLRVESVKIAHTVAADFAEEMKNTLIFRRNLKGGGGRFPRWNPSQDGRKATRPLSKQSYSKWVVKENVASSKHKKLSKGGFISYALMNIGDPEQAGYMKMLVTGKGWNHKGNPGGKNKDGHPARLNKEGFSTQMPEGLDPWLKLKKGELKDIFKHRFGAMR